MKTINRMLLATALALFAQAAFAQSALLQSGPVASGHAPMYVNSGTSQPVVQDSGTAGGGAPGIGLSEMGLTARGTGTPPYAGQGKGPYGTNWCDYDAPITNATGYHYLCLSPNAAGGGLISYGFGGTANALPLSFKINGTTIPFPGNIVTNTFSDNLTSTGSTQGTAYTVTSSVSAFTTVASGTGAILPTTTGLADGTPYTIINAGTNPLSVYPPLAGSINGGATNAAVTLYENSRSVFTFRASNATWYAR